MMRSLCLVRECEELEEALMTTHTGSILRGEAVETRDEGGDQEEGQTAVIQPGVMRSLP